MFHSDCGEEYIDTNCQKLFATEGIIWEPLPAYIHESNGIAERFNCTIITMARGMVMDFNLLKFLWAEAIVIVVYLKNRFFYISLKNTTLYQQFHGKKPVVKHLHLFGKKCYAHIHKEARSAYSKLDFRATDAIFVGYTSSNKIFRVYISSKRFIKEVRDFDFASWSSPTSGGGIEIELAGSALFETSLQLLLPATTKPFELDQGQEGSESSGTISPEIERCSTPRLFTISPAPPFTSSKNQSLHNHTQLSLHCTTQLSVPSQKKLNNMAQNFAKKPPTITYIDSYVNDNTQKNEEPWSPKNIYYTFNVTDNKEIPRTFQKTLTSPCAPK